MATCKVLHKASAFPVLPPGKPSEAPLLHPLQHSMAELCLELAQLLHPTLDALRGSPLPGHLPRLERIMASCR